MPNHIGAFLKASKCFASLGINITQFSYDKAVDSHMQCWALAIGVFLATMVRRRKIA